MGGILTSDSRANSDRDLTFTSADFRRVRDMVYRHVGISLSEAKFDMAYSRLARRVRAMGEKRFSAYLDAFATDEGHPEWQFFINALTTNLTAFFREAHHFDLLNQDYCQRLDTEPYRVWCAAVSSGEEAYSVAITLADSRSRGSSRFEILASDIDTQVLGVAAQGVYTLERVAQMNPTQLRAHFQKGGGGNAGKVRIKRELREAIRFVQLNLIADSWPEIGGFDAVFCRNVLIYFDLRTQTQILARLAQHIKSNGLLFLGHSENIQHLSHDFTPVGQTTYRRVA